MSKVAITYQGQDLIFNRRDVDMLRRFRADGVEYVIAPTIGPRFEVSSDGNSMTIDVGAMEAVNGCEHCGRADYGPKVAGSFEEAVEFGWMIPTSAIRDLDDTADA